MPITTELTRMLGITVCFRKILLCQVVADQHSTLSSKEVRQKSS